MNFNSQWTNKRQMNQTNPYKSRFQHVDPTKSDRSRTACYRTLRPPAPFRLSWWCRFGSANQVTELPWTRTGEAACSLAGAVLCWDLDGKHCINCFVKDFKRGACCQKHVTGPFGFSRVTQGNLMSPDVTWVTQGKSKSDVQLPCLDLLVFLDCLADVLQLCPYVSLLSTFFGSRHWTKSNTHYSSLILGSLQASHTSDPPILHNLFWDVARGCWSRAINPAGRQDPSDDHHNSSAAVNWTLRNTYRHVSFIQNKQSQQDCIYCMIT